MINKQWLKQKIIDGENAEVDFKLEWHANYLKFKHEGINEFISNKV